MRLPWPYKTNAWPRNDLVCIESATAAKYKGAQPRDDKTNTMTDVNNLGN